MELQHGCNTCGALAHDAMHRNCCDWEGPGRSAVGRGLTSLRGKVSYKVSSGVKPGSVLLSR